MNNKERILIALGQYKDACEDGAADGDKASAKEAEATQQQIDQIKQYGLNVK